MPAMLDTAALMFFSLADDIISLFRHYFFFDAGSYAMQSPI